MARQVQPQTPVAFLGWTVREYADLWGVHPDQVRGWIRAGLLGCVRPSPRCTRITPADHDAFLASTVLTPAAERDRRRGERAAGRGWTSCR